MIGAIIGDIVGSRFEFKDEKRTKGFRLFEDDCHPTDDTYMTIAVALALVEANGNYDNLDELAKKWMHKVGCDHRTATWGKSFYDWLFVEGKDVPYNSYGNGSGMRVSAVGWVADSEEQVKELSYKVTAISHNHPLGLKGAEAVAMAVYMARVGKPMKEIRNKMTEYYPILLDKKFNMRELFANYGYDHGTWITCEGSIPQALLCFLESTSFEDAIRNAIAIGGDSDTIGAMTGSIAEAYYGVPDKIKDEAFDFLTSDILKACKDFKKIRKPRVER